MALCPERALGGAVGVSSDQVGGPASESAQTSFRGVVPKPPNTTSVRTAGLNAGYKDNDKYNTSLNEIVTIEDKAVAPLSDTTLTDPELKDKIENICLPLWKQAEDKLKQMQAYEVSASVQKKTIKLLEYIQLRRKELDVFNKMIETQEQESLIPSLNEIRDSISVIGAAIQKL